MTTRRSSLHIGFVIDHPKRDLGGAAMVAHAAVKRGHRISIIPLYDQAIDVPLLGLDGLIVNYARPANFDLIRGYAQFGLPVFVLDTEGGVLAPDALQLAPRLIREAKCADFIAGHLFWGTHQRDAFIADGILPASRLFVTGCPRFDFASAKWLPMLAYHSSNFVLVNANFPLINSRFTSSNKEELDTMVRAGWAADYLEAIVADQKVILRGYLATVRALALLFPARQFLVRPHPFERVVLYEEAFAGLPNVTVDGAGNVLNVIHHSATVLHLNCGTSVEAIMLRKVPLSMEFLNTERMRSHIPLPSEISWRATSIEAIVAAIQDIGPLEESFDFDAKYREHIFPWFYANDGMAADRVIDAVVGVIGPSDRCVRPSLGWSLASSRVDSRNVQKLQALLANLLGSRATAAIRSRFVPLRREKHTSPEAARSLLARLAAIDGSRPPSVHRARHPVTGAPLASLTAAPDPSA